MAVAQKITKWAAGHPLHLILLTGLIQGLLYTFMVPPWWNHDETGHFEFAWQIANFDRWPQADEFDPDMRLELARSMDRYDRFMDFEIKPDISGNVPIYIGIPQHTKYPLYHILASLPLRFLKNTDLVTQLYSARLLSTALFIVTLWLAWMALGEILPKDHSLRWLTVAFMTLLPGLADVMTSVNDDVMAVLAFTLFLWTCLLLIQRGLTWGRFLGLLATLGLCFWAKNTAWSAIPLSLVALLFSLFRKKFRWMPWAVIGFILFTSPFIILRWGDAGLWYRETNQPVVTRLKTDQAVLGDYALHITFLDDNGLRLNQLVDTPVVRPLRGKWVTLGTWMWADRPIRARIPYLQMKILNGNPQYREPSKYVMLTTTPTFYSQTFKIPLEAENGILRIWPLPQIEEGGAPVSIYLDGIVLAQGVLDGVAQFNNSLGTSGNWSDSNFLNILRNGSAEKGWIYLSPQISRMIDNAFPGSLNSLIGSLQDWQNSRGHYRASLLHLFQTFWSKVPGARVTILGSDQVYPLLQWLTVLGLMGGIFMMAGKSKFLPWSPIFFLGISLIIVWGMTIARGGSELLSTSPLLPWARYAYPVILPTALLLVAGWRQVMQWVRVPAIWRGILFVAFMVALNILTLISVIVFFAKL